MPIFTPPGDEFRKRRGAYLPHWTQANATYFVTFRLADSIPRERLEAYEYERDARILMARNARDEAAELEARQEFLRKVHRFLDQGNGVCWMKDKRAAKVVADSIKHFDAERYELWAWCVMPNHVHVIVQPKTGHELSEVLQGWKSFTSKEIGKIVGVNGRIWMAESFDHVVRSGRHLRKFVRYTTENPAKAGLREWPWAWGVAMDEET